MTGLCGYYQKNNHNTAGDTVLAAMLDKITRQKPLQRSHVFNKNNASTSALAIAGFTQQAIFNTPELMVACSGHISWKQETLKELARHKGNAAVIAQLYREHGTDLFQHIHSDFSLVIIDRKIDKLILAIDRTGIQRLCFYSSGNSIIFSSDIQALFAHPETSRTLSEQGIFNYFYFHMVPSPSSIYKGVEKLLPGQYAVFSKGNLTRHFYWKIDYHDNSPESFEHLNNQFGKILKNSVSTRLAEPSTGAFLSGGLDSSTVSGVLSELQDSAKTFSIGFDVDGYDETPFARRVAKHFNTDHHEYYVTPEDVLNAIPLIARTYDEPFGNASAIPAYYCAKFAQEHGIKTMIGGDGGDEIFAGNERYTKQTIFEAYEHIPNILRKSIVEPIFLKTPGVSSLPIFKKINSYIKQANIPLPARLETYNFLNQTPIDDIFNKDFLSEINSQWPIEMLSEVYKRTNSDNTLHKMLHLDMKVTIADNDIRKVNTMCSLAGVDVVYPFLDDDMVNFAATIPPQLKIKQGKLRYFFKQSMTGFLPEETINKQKHGFGLPFGIWMKEYKPLHDMARESLNSLAKRGFFNKNYIDGLWKLHEGEHSAYYGVMIWVMMMFEQWLSATEEMNA